MRRPLAGTWQNRFPSGCGNRQFNWWTWPMGRIRLGNAIRKIRRLAAGN